jgi:hypothetical protein
MHLSLAVYDLIKTYIFFNLYHCTLPSTSVPPVLKVYHNVGAEVIEIQGCNSQLTSAHRKILNSRIKKCVSTSGTMGHCEAARSTVTVTKQKWHFTIHNVMRAWYLV